MAKVASTLTLLSLLFAFTYARTPFDIPENDVTFLDLSTPLRENDVAKPKLPLPSEKPIDEPNTPKIADNQTPAEIKNDDVGVAAEEEDQKPVEGKNRLVAEEEDQKPVDGKNDGVVAVQEDQNTVENKIYGVAAVEGKGFDREMFHSVSAVHPRWMKPHHHGEHEGRPWFPFFGRHHHHDHDDHHRHDHHDDDHDHNHHHDDDHDDDDDHDHDDDHNHHHDHHHDDDDRDDDHDYNHDHHHDDDDHDDDHDHHDHHGEHQRSIRRPFIRRDQVEEEKEEREGDGGFLDGILDFFDDLF